MYVPVVTSSIEVDHKHLKWLKTGFKWTIKGNKYRSEIAKQAKTNYLNYLIDSTFNKIKRLFALSFENEDYRTSFWKYYTPKTEIRFFFFFDMLLKSKEETYDSNIETNSNRSEQINWIRKPWFKITN